jgi:hypothetical protein
MRLPRVRVNLRGAMIAVAVFASITAVVREAVFGESAAYKQGRREALAELAAGKATLYTYGLRDFGEDVDRETGLRYHPIAGCLVDDAIVDRTNGHNEQILESIRTAGLPANSLKPWRDDLFNLRPFFETRARSGPPVGVNLDGPAAASPDGKYSIRRVRRTFQKDDGSPGEGSAFVIVAGADTHPPLHIWGDEGEATLVWGDDASGFAVLRFRGDDGQNYVAVDLREGCVLRSESSPVADGRAP